MRIPKRSTKGHREDTAAYALRLAVADAENRAERKPPSPAKGRRIDPALPEGQAIAQRFGALPK